MGMRLFKLLKLAKTRPIRYGQELPFCTHFLSFFPSVALLCNLKKPSTGYKIANFRYNPKSLNHFNIKIYLLFTICVAVQLSCREESNKAIKTVPVTFKKEGDLRILKKESDSLLTTFDIEIADTDYERETGLMYRSSMEPSQGMLFVFDDVSMHYFYMKNTEFPLDLIFVDDQMKIASFQKNSRPLNENSLSSKVPVKYVLEVNAGMADKWSLSIGDSIVYREIP